ncbi:3-carboxymuconate cyclase [Verrucomicrobia bacterium]|nr:3-carboxymuconate cyclase [Verrucomicrobiota bacterium]
MSPFQTMNLSSKGKIMISSNQSRKSAAQSRAECYLFLLLAALLAAACVPGRARAQGIEQRLYSFGLPGADYPEAPLVQGADGALYGTSYLGGTNNDGTVFRIGTNGTGYAVLYSFTGTDGDGAKPFAGLIQSADGALYGTTGTGGSSNSGTVFKIGTNGSGYAVLYSFTGTGGDGYGPNGLIEGADGALYGTTGEGGTNSAGTVFRLGTGGSGYAVLYRFIGTGSDGAAPNGLIQGADGALYGTTFNGGTNSAGTVFRIGTNGSGYAPLYSFTGTGGDGRAPDGLIQGADGALYGTTGQGGTNGNGTVFRIGTNGSGYAVLYRFTGFTGTGDGLVPNAGLIQGADGALYGTTYCGGTGVGGTGGGNGDGTVFRIGTNGSPYAVLYRFTGTGGDGRLPDAGLIQGADGALYGTTSGGTGAGNGDGIVFRIRTNGNGYAVLYRFIGTGGDGLQPFAGLIQGADGALYGTTSYGGTNDDGTVFRIGTDGSGYGVLYSFTGTGGDGLHPDAGLIQGADGALYGTTLNGGTNGYGTMFRIGTNGSGYAVLYSFTGRDGLHPDAGLIQGADGALYGITERGGTNNFGAVFRIGTNGSGYAVLYSFTGTGGDGANPEAGLIQGVDGALYGTTEAGGTNGDGTVFRIGTNGSGYAPLYSFTGAGGDGAGPDAGLIQGADGALYGTTSSGGTNYDGTVFRIGTNGSGYAVLYRFTGMGGDGAEPSAGLIQGADGALYGTTSYGGTGAGYSGNGTVFRLIPWPVGAGFLQISRAAGQGAQLSFVPPVDAASAISVSSDLIDWTLLTNLPASLGPVYFIDASATNFAHRFYRASWTQ